MNDHDVSEELLSDLAELVDGEDRALDRHEQELGESDAARDLLHEARQAADAVTSAGDDYLPPEDLEARVLAALDSQSAGAPTVTPESATEEPAPTARSEAQPPEDLATPPAPRSSPEPASEDRGGAQKGNGKGVLLVLLAGGGLALAAAAAVALAFGLGAFGQGGSPLAHLGGVDLPSASLSRVVRAADDGQTGVQLAIDPDAGPVAVTAGASVPPNAQVSTDARTRLELSLADGSTVVLDRSSRVRVGTEPRTLHLLEGQLVADVAHLDDGSHARFLTPAGEVEVLGTKFVLTADEDGTSVQVTRGEVRATAKGETVMVKAGEEGILPMQGRPSVSPAVDLASAVAFSELDPAVGEELPIQGLGELRARRPGEREERERPLTLADHRVKVRIVGGVARTEIEETFQNDDDHTLEGVYRFPLPPNARIASLALEVDDHWEEGAFVAKERARRIFQGVIRHATPVRQRMQQEEYIWVPGPWRDPALLEWQNGGRVQLRIFPIPAHGSRRVRIAYEQQVTPHGRERRYTYPLPFSADGSTRVGHFEVDARVAGLGQGSLKTRGYAMDVAREGDAQRAQLTARDFRPAGSLVIDYALPDGEAELRTYTFAAPRRGLGGLSGVTSTRGGRGGDEAGRARQRLRDDSRGYVLFNLRPDLPDWTEQRPTEWVLVIDSSQSMIGDRFAQATRLTRSLVGELDRRDSVRVLACDATCREFSGQAQPVSARLAAEVGQWLERIRPAGSSDLEQALREAVSAPEDSGRARRVLYVGDGRSSVGHRLPATLGPRVAELAERSGASISALGVGEDADRRVLETVARAGLGHFIPWVPGQGANAAAMAVLESGYGASLEAPQLRLPSGLEAVAPRTLPNLRDGEEIQVVARVVGSRVQGEVELTGKVGGRAFERRYNVDAQVTEAAGNGFVPRAWAAKRIEDLEREGRGEDVSEIVALSETFGVLSRETSLLVLESPTMFSAYGIDRSGPVAQWSGEEDTESSVGNVVGGVEDALDIGALGSTRSGAGFGGLGTLGAGSGAGAGVVRSSAGRPARRHRPAPRPSTPSAAPMDDSVLGAAPSVSMAAPSPDRFAERERRARSRRPPRGGMWMRRVWHREGFVEGEERARRRLSRDEAAVATAESALRDQPDSRDRHRALVRALSRVGDLRRAREVIEAWMERDRLDPEALTYYSDLLGREGDADAALRELSGVVDLEPDNLVLQKRLANAFDRVGDRRRACSHRVAIAEIQKTDTDAIGAAVRCERAQGDSASAERLLALLPDARARDRAETAARSERAERVRGDLVLDASWSGDEDLDLSLITPQGTRLSWMGGRTSVVGDRAERRNEERLGLRRAARGSYYIEISRKKGDEGAPIDGRVRVDVLGQHQTLPFTLRGDRALVGVVRVAGRWRLERVGGRGGRGGRGGQDDFGF